MKKNFFIKQLVLLATIALLSSNAMAGIPIGFAPTLVTTPGSASQNVNRGYAGLKWTLGQGITPSAVIGFRHANVEAGGHVDGGDISMSFNFAGGFQLGKLRAKYLNGQENVQGELGGGYDFTKNGLFAGASVQGPFVNAGADLGFNSGFEPYVMINTLRKYHKPTSSTSSYVCPTGFTSFPTNAFAPAPFGCQ